MKKLGKVFTALVFVFMYAPILVMVFFSFNSSRSTSVFERFSFYWYREMFSSSDTIGALRNTLILAVLSALIATVLGTAAAVALHRMKRGVFRTSLTTVTNVPMMNPDIVTGVSLMLLFVFIGRIVGAKTSLSFFTLLIAHVTFNLPYVILNVLPKLGQMDVFLTEAALDLGATPMQSFFKVELPAIMPGVLSGLIMSFTLSIDDFVISHFTNGPDFQTLPLKIYSMTKKTVKPDMYALSTLIFVSILVLMIAINLIQTRTDKRAVRKKKTSLSKGDLK